MQWTQNLQLYSIVLILTLFNPFMSMKTHGALVNRLLAFFDQDERQQIMEDFLRQLATQPYDKGRGADFPSAEEEIDNYLRFVPHLQPYRPILVNIYRNKRQAAGLKDEPKAT